MMITRLAWLFALLLLADLYAADPTISSASIASGTITISGTNFETKAPVAPLEFQPFTNTATGQTYSQAGFDFVAGNNTGTANNHVEMSDGVGGGSWLHITPGGGAESFSHFGHLLPDQSNAVYSSCWMKFSRKSALGEGGFGQIKVMRSGLRTGTNAHSNMYTVNPKVYPSLYDRLEDPNDLSGPNTDWTNAAATTEPTGTIYPEGLYDVPITDGNWHFFEIYYRFNDLGLANGIIQIRVNGTQHINVSNIQPRTTASEYFQYIQYCPGLANSFDQSVWHARFTRIYTDTTRARVFLGNASSLASCTRRFLLNPSAWSNTEISATDAADIPTGFDWVYVSNRNGQINATGYAYTAKRGKGKGPK